MDLDVIEGLNEVVPAVYRAAFKLRSLQNLCQMHVVRLSAIGPALHRLGVAVGPGGGVTEAEMGRSLGQLFRGVSAELPGQVPPGGAEQTSRLLFRLFDREQTGCISLRSVEAALTALSGDTLSAKHAALYQLAERCSGRQGRESGTVSRSGLRALLEDLSQIPAVVQESHVFGAVESAVRTCFQGVLSAGVSEEVFLRWLRSEPRLLLWLSTLYRLSVSEAVLHRVRCHVCKAFPITGLRYRCLKCVNVHLCQTCFLTHKRSRKHKPSHPVMEHCTQPSFRESLTSLAHSARHTLMRRRLATREAERRSALCTEIPPRMPCSAPTASVLSQTTPPQTREPPPGPSATPRQPSATPRQPSATPRQPRLKSKGLQTDTALQPQRKTSLLKKDLSQTRMAVRDLQREKWQLEKQLQAWRETVESEHSSLEDKCCHLEATVEVLTQHNQNLQDELAQIRLLPLYMIPVPGVSLATVSGEGAGDSETWESEREQTAGERPLQEEEAPTEVQVSESEEEPKATQTPGAGDADPQCGGDPAHSPQQEEDQGCAGKALVDRSESLLEQEEELGDLVLHLKSALAVDRCTGAGSVQTQELLAAAEAVEDSVSQLVCAVSSYALASQPRPPHGPALSTNQAAALSQLRSHCTQWASARSCSRSQSTAQTHSTAAGRPLWASGHQKRKV
ncbi:dystrotelin [Conger conger]|uniref:dystrotelin n=1 Tax=Conger conger TaxID=82655 RepID=UPI002A59D558|nr:dystrotelin [Conger conger]